MRLFARLGEAQVQTQVQARSAPREPSESLALEDREWLDRAYHVLASNDHFARQGILISKFGALVKRGSSTKNNSMQKILGRDGRFIVTASMTGASRVALRL
jgi:hypothetical protein